MNSHDLLKFAAIILMVVDHAGFYFFPHASCLRLIGRVSFPIFFFLIGYSLNYKIRKDLLIMALLLAANDFLIGWQHLPLNILFSVIFCRMFLVWVEKKGYLREHLLDVVVVLVFLAILTPMIFEYGTAAMLFSLLGVFTRKRDEYRPPVYLYITTLITYCFFQILGFSFDYVQSVLLILGMALITWMFMQYRFRKFPAVPKYLSYPAMFIGRNSLAFYFLHVTLFRWAWHFLQLKGAG